MSIKFKPNCYPYIDMKMMNSELEHTDFTTYTFETFLQNDFFISSMKYPTEETLEFWKNFVLQNPSNIDEFIAAKEYINTLSSTEKYLLSVEEIEQLRNRIETTSVNKKKVRYKKLFIKSISIAASIAILIGCLFFFKNNQSAITPDIKSFAIQTKEEIPVTEETLLILAEDKVVSISEKESEITYESEEIKANEKSISKEEVATYNQLVIPWGKRSVLTFSDGSKAWVNAGTRVIYPMEFEKNKREIYVDGEIYIEVAKDESRPFFVQTKDMNVRVLGTRFNVNAYESEIMRSVVLAQGSVQVETVNTPKAILSPNQMFSSVDGVEKITEVDVDQMISWIYGIYTFNSVELGVVFKRLSDYYGVNIEFDPVLNKMKCSGKIDLKDNFETVINGLTFAAPIDYTYNAPLKKYQIVKK